MQPGLFAYNADLQKSQPRLLKLVFDITGAKTVKDLTYAGQAFKPFFDALSSQTTDIDDFLGTEDEFALAAFDSTAMGADAFGCIVNMAGQCARVISMTAKCYSSSNTLVTRQVQAASALTDSSLTTEIAKGADGNIALRVDFGNTPDLDGLTDGTIEIDILWHPK